MNRLCGIKAVVFCLLRACGFVAIALSPLCADACNRCGRYGSACGYVAYSAPYVAPVIAAVPNVYVVNNNYPQPLVPSGSSTVQGAPSYGSQYGPVYFDANRANSDTVEMMKSSQQMLSSALAGQQNNARAFWELQQPAMEAAAKGQAAQQMFSGAAEMIRATGLDPAHNTNGGQVQSNGVAIVRGQLIQLTAQQIQALTDRALQPQSQPPQARPPTTIVPNEPQPQRAPAGGSLIARFCGKCHGLDVAKPPKGLQLAADPRLRDVLRGRYVDIEVALWPQEEGAAASMPPAEVKDQPTDEQRQQIMQELKATIFAR